MRSHKVYGASTQTLRVKNQLIRVIFHSYLLCVQAARLLLLRYLFRNISKYTVRHSRSKIKGYLDFFLNTFGIFYFNPTHIMVLLNAEDSLTIYKGVLDMNGNDKLRRSNFVLIGLIVLMLLYGVTTRFMTGDTSLYIFGIPIIAPKETQEENTNSQAPSDDARALFETIDALLS